MIHSFWIFTTQSALKFLMIFTVFYIQILSEANYPYMLYISQIKVKIIMGKKKLLWQFWINCKKRTLILTEH